MDKNSKQQGGVNLPTRLNLLTRNSEVASVSNYGEINNVNTADLDKEKNMTVKQYPKSNTV